MLPFGCHCLTEPGNLGLRAAYKPGHTSSGTSVDFFSAITSYQNSQRKAYFKNNFQSTTIEEDLTMLLHKLFFFLLSFVCTLSSAQPHCQNTDVTNAIIRNINGASATYLQDHVAISILQHYVTPSEDFPQGGVVVNVTNAYCFDIEVTFTLENGQGYIYRIRSGQHNIHLLIPGRVLYAHEIRVSIETEAFNW
jgi:hypothetical protein